MHSMLYMSKQWIHSLHNILKCNGMHVDVVYTIELQCRFSLLYMLILAISISNAFNAIYVKAVDTFSTQYTQM